MKKAALKLLNIIHENRRCRKYPEIYLFIYTMNFYPKIDDRNYICINTALDQKLVVSNKNTATRIMSFNIIIKVSPHRPTFENM
jgi:hypothetical protein